MADIPIQLRYSTTLAQIPTTAPSGPGQLVIGEVAFNIAAAGATKMWVGDNVAGNNRLLLSTDDADTPVLTNRYLKISGNQTLTGPLMSTGTPGASDGSWLVNKDYVDQAIISGQQRLGAYDAFTNTPPLNPPTPTPSNGQYREVNVAGTAPTSPAIPGILGGTQLNPGSRLVWNTTLPGFELIPGGGITQGDADLRYVMLAGSTMAAGASITFPVGYTPTTNQVVTLGNVTTQLGSYLPLIGGTLTGPVFINHNAATPPVIGLAELRLRGDNNEATRLVIEAYNDNPAIAFRRSGGTGALPAFPGNNENLGAVSFGSEVVNPDPSVFGARIRAITGEQWSAANQGCHITFDCTANGTATRTLNVVDITADGIAVQGRATLTVGPRTTGGDNDVVRKQDVDASITRISGGTY